MAHDRLWAIAHGGSEWDPEAPAWASAGNFVRVAHVPEFARISAAFDALSGTLRLSHPERPELSIVPGSDAGDAALTEWISPLAQGRRPGPYRVAHVPGGALADVDEPWVSIKSLASLRALGEHLGVTLDPRRFRGNLWLDGLAPWEERGWIGRKITIGAVRLHIEEPVERCRATEANPATGTYDLATVNGLRAVVGEPEFGVYARVIEGGEVAIGDAVTTPAGA